MYAPIFDNKYICLSEINEYLTDNITSVHNNIKNKKYNDVLALSKLIWDFVSMSINRMNKYNNANKKINNINDAYKK